jgi:hypothetical protein
MIRLLVKGSNNEGGQANAMIEATQFMDDLKQKGVLHKYNTIGILPLRDKNAAADVKERAVNLEAQQQKMFDAMVQHRNVDKAICAFYAKLFACFIVDGFSTISDVYDISEYTHNVTNALKDVDNYWVVYIHI